MWKRREKGKGCVCEGGLSLESTLWLGKEHQIVGRRAQSVKAEGEGAASGAIAQLQNTAVSTASAALGTAQAAPEAGVQSASSGLRSEALASGLGQKYSGASWNGASLPTQSLGL